MKYSSEVHDEIGPWSEVKLDIIKRYATEYTKILNKQCKEGVLNNFFYIDAFAGSGIHKSKTSGSYVPGSPLNAFNVEPPFNEYHFIDLDDVKVESLEEIAQNDPRVTVHNQDCNVIIPELLETKLKWNMFNRALLILDPYHLQFSWSLVEAAGKLGTVDLFINFPISDINRNVLRNNPKLRPKVKLVR